MGRTTRGLGIWFGFVLIVLACTTAARSAHYFETSSSPGVAQSGGDLIGPTQYLGVRFQVTQPITITSAGFRAARTALSGNGSVFATVIALASATDFPDSANPVNTPDVLASALIDPPASGTADIAAALGPITLTPGYYALMVGGGSFGANGECAATQNNPQNGSYSYFFWNTGNNHYVNGGSGNVRMFFDADPVPEPTGIALLAMPLLLLRRGRR